MHFCIQNKEAVSLVVFGEDVCFSFPHFKSMEANNLWLEPIWNSKT